MNCEEALQLISEELDGKLDEARRALLEEHLSSCEDCRNARQALSQIDDALRQTQLDAPPELQDRVMRSIRREKRRKRFAWIPAAGLAAAAALAIILSGTHLLGQPGLHGSTTASLRPTLLTRSGREQRRAEARAQQLADETGLPVVLVRGSAPAELAELAGEPLGDGAVLYPADEALLQALADADGAVRVHPAKTAADAGGSGFVLLIP